MKVYVGPTQSLALCSLASHKICPLHMFYHLSWVPHQSQGLYLDTELPKFELNKPLFTS